MQVQQIELTLPPFSRGFHLITEHVEQALERLEYVSAGSLHIFLQHTSASISLNENADPTVRTDLEAFMNRYVPENEPYFRHTYEGPDDMPAHIKSALIGVQLTIPVSEHRMCLGTWQGVYLGEHRNEGGIRRLILTLTG